MEISTILEISKTELCKEMVYGKTKKVKNMWEIGETIRHMAMEYIQQLKVITKVSIDVIQDNLLTLLSMDMG